MTTTPDLAPADVLTTILADRYSCRGFRPEPVDAVTLRRLFTMAQRTASWCNSQAWQVHLLSGEDAGALSERLLARAQAGPEAYDIPGPASYDGVYRDRRRACGFALYESVGVTRDDLEGRIRQGLENFRFFGAPHVAIVTAPRALGTYGVLDCGGYVATLLAAARSLGVDSIAQAAIASYSDAVREHLAVPDDRWVVCGVALGYADHDHPANRFRTERAGIDDVVHGLPPVP